MSLELLAVFANVRGSLPTQKEVEADGGQERYRGRNLKPAISEPGESVVLI